MIERFAFALSPFALFGVLLASAPAMAQPPQPGTMMVVDGQAYWEGDPGPVQPSSYWTGNAFPYDPHNYNNRYPRDPGLYYETVYADHAGKERCVWRKRVINTNWEFNNPFLRVCRK